MDPPVSDFYISLIHLAERIFNLSLNGFHNQSVSQEINEKEEAAGCDWLCRRNRGGSRRHKHDGVSIRNTPQDLVKIKVPSYPKAATVTETNC